MDEEWKNFTGSFKSILAATGIDHDEEARTSLTSASGTLLSARPNTPGSVGRSRSKEMSGLLMLGETLSNMGLSQQSSSVVETALKQDPTDPMALQIRDELAACGHTVLLSINLAELIGIETIELSAGTNHQQITIRHDEHGTYRLRPTSGTLERWYQQLHRVWMEAVSLLNTPKYDHCMRVSETVSKLVFEYNQAAEMFEGSWTPGERRDKQVAVERAKYVEAKFRRAFAKVQPEQDPSRWSEWIANEPQGVISQADELMEELALGMAQAGSHHEIANWYATEFYKRFRLMLQAFGIRVGENIKRSTSEALAAIEADEGGLNSSIASSVALSELVTTDAMAIIGWCRGFSQRCFGMRIPAGLFEEDPTDSGIFRGLVNAHMPSYQGYLKKKTTSGTSGLVGAWQKRYFCLTNGILSYYKTKQMAEQQMGERGSIPAEVITELWSEGRTVKVTESGRVLELYASEEHEATVWMDRLQKARDAALAMDQLTRAHATPFEVQAFDGQQQVAVHSVARDCQELFEAANESLQLQLLSSTTEEASGLKAKLYMDTSDALLEALEGRLRRVPGDRVDVKTFYALEYHRNIGQNMSTVCGLWEWPTVGVCRLMFWAREHDQTIARTIGRMLTGGEKPLAQNEVWERDLPGFSKHALPRFNGWLTRQRWEDHEWETNYVVVENLRLTWYSYTDGDDSSVEPEPEPDGSVEDHEASLTELIASWKEVRDIMRETGEDDPQMEELQSTANEVLEEIGRAESKLRVGGTISLSEGTQFKSSMNRDGSGDDTANCKIGSVDGGFVLLKVPRNQMVDLMECLNHSCYPTLPGQSRDRALSAGEAINARGAQIVADYHKLSKEEQTAAIAEEFRQAFAAEGGRLLDGGSGSVALEAVLNLFSIMMEQLVEVVDEVLFSGLIEEEIINFNINARHQQFVRYFTNLCDPDKELIEGSDLDITVTRTDIVPLLRWAAEYHSVVASIGLQNADVDALEGCCSIPMTAHVAHTRDTFGKWCLAWVPPKSLESGLEKVKQSRDLYITSLPNDLFRLICDATRQASDSASEWLLVNTVMGAIEPQVVSNPHLILIIFT